MQSKEPVLVVEDDKGILESLQELLETEGYTVYCAANGQKALNLLRASTKLPGLILLDLMMPVMDGFQFREAQERDEKFGNIPVVIMTADGHIEIKKVRIGAKGFLKKPLEIDEVINTVEKFCR